MKYRLNFNNINTEHVTNMHGMFTNCTKLTSIDLSNFNTINVKPKKKRVGRYPGKTVKVKKAIVKLSEGSSIELN